MTDEEITQLLDRWNRGDRAAADRVLTLLYDDLRRIAARYLRRERPNHTLQATAVVHEAFVRLVEDRGLRWNNRAHFIGLTAHVMRRILVQHARQHKAHRRGGHLQRVTLAEAASVADGNPPDLLAVDAALSDLARVDQRKASLVEMRFFGGLTLDEAAEQIGISRATAVREWRRARSWLYLELNQRGWLSDDASGGGSP